MKLIRGGQKRSPLAQTQLNNIFSIEELDEPVADHRPELKSQKSNANESESCEVLWDQSSKDSVMMKKIRYVHGKKRIVDISIDTSSESLVRDLVEEDEFEIYSIFDKIQFV
ncbi:Hypothetical_protein [Hexamita inflata]|uniref:Hypothetical_protein n=1 Tax=Hexamita inflata TaxID=28002 RepID=A0AA86PQS2_9EUKA|nr:Hypothetical protein HINF_LOCUS32089 [Hexamita inflata]